MQVWRPDGVCAFFFALVRIWWINCASFSTLSRSRKSMMTRPIVYSAVRIRMPYGHKKLFVGHTAKRWISPIMHSGSG